MSLLFTISRIFLKTEYSQSDRISAYPAKIFSVLPLFEYFYAKKDRVVFKFMHRIFNKTAAVIFQKRF